MRQEPVTPKDPENSCSSEFDKTVSSVDLDCELLTVDLDCECKIVA